MRRTGAKTRLARRVGEPLRDKDAKYLVKRNYPPGMHGQTRRRFSEYAIQLREKQKAKWMYDVTERQFRKYVDLSLRKKEITGNVLLSLLESRLDNIVYRLGFGTTRAQARQLVSHGFFAVDGKKVDIPSYQTKAGDVVSVLPQKQNSKYIQNIFPALKEHKPLEWLSLDAKTMSGKVLSTPNFDNTGSTLQMNLIIEHYSR